MKRQHRRAAGRANRRVGLRARKIKIALATSILLVVGLGAAAAPALAQLNCGSAAECRNLGQAYLNQSSDMAKSDRRTAVARMTEEGPTATPIPVTVVVEHTVVVPVRETVVVPVRETVMVQAPVYVTVLAPLPTPVPAVVEAAPAPVQAGPGIGERVADLLIPKQPSADKPPQEMNVQTIIFLVIILFIVGAFVWIIWVVVIRPLIHTEVKPPPPPTDWWG